MRQITRNPSIWLGGLELPINVTPETGQGCYVEMLEAMHSQMHAALTIHRRVMVLRFDLRQYDYSDSSGHLTGFFRKLKRRLKECYGMTDVGHVWAREQESGKGQHYHCALIMDGKLVKSPHRVLKYIEAMAEGWGWPKPFTPERCFYDIRHGDTGELERAFYRLSYLAKTKGKHCGAKLSNNYSTSQLKPKRTISTNQKHLALPGERSPKQKVLSKGVAPAGHTYTQKCTCASEQEPGAVIRMSG